MFDYNSSDGNYKESQYRECPECIKGLIDGIPCEKCRGTGQIELTDEEIEYERQCRIDDEADKMRD